MAKPRFLFPRQPKPLRARANHVIQVPLAERLPLTPREVRQWVARADPTPIQRLYWAVNPFFWGRFGGIERNLNRSIERINFYSSTIRFMHGHADAYVSGGNPFREEVLFAPENLGPYHDLIRRRIWWNRVRAIGKLVLGIPQLTSLRLFGAERLLKMAPDSLEPFFQRWTRRRQAQTKGSFATWLPSKHDELVEMLDSLRKERRKRGTDEAASETASLQQAGMNELVTLTNALRELERARVGDMYRVLRQLAILRQWRESAKHQIKIPIREKRVEEATSHLNGLIQAKKLVDHGEEEHDDAYFDDENGSLQKKGISLRVRTIRKGSRTERWIILNRDLRPPLGEVHPFYRGKEPRQIHEVVVAPETHARKAADILEQVGVFVTEAPQTLESFTRALQRKGIEVAFRIQKTRQVIADPKGRVQLFLDRNICARKGERTVELAPHLEVEVTRPKKGWRTLLEEVGLRMQRVTGSPFLRPQRAFYAEMARKGLERAA